VIKEHNKGTKGATEKAEHGVIASNTEVFLVRDG
jgi:hypothetical protein